MTTIAPNQTISFKYNRIEIPDDLNWNEVPYISTYYIKPIVKPGEEVFIDYYITDYYYKEYMEKKMIGEMIIGQRKFGITKPLLLLLELKGKMINYIIT